MSIPLRRFYLLTHTPVELARPVVMCVERATGHTDALFYDYKIKTEQERKQGSQNVYLSKRDIEKWHCWPPCGSRVQVIELNEASMRSIQRETLK